MYLMLRRVGYIMKALAHCQCHYLSHLIALRDPSKDNNKVAAKYAILLLPSPASPPPRGNNGMQRMERDQNDCGGVEAL